MSARIALVRERLHLLDRRPPQALQAALERNVMTVFAPQESGTPAARTARFVADATHYEITLTWVDALPAGHAYRLDIDASVDPDTRDLDGARRWAEGCLQCWTAGLATQAQPAQGEGSARRRERLLVAWRAAEAPLEDVAATQQAILRALRRGMEFRTSHKEGGTTIRASRQGFVRTDHGDWHGTERFATESAVLAHLRKFYDYQTSCHSWPVRVPEAVAWRLIYRRLEAGTSIAHASPAVWLACLAVCLLAGWLMYLRLHRGPEAPPALTTTPFTRAAPSAESAERLRENERRFHERIRAITGAASH